MMKICLFTRIVAVAFGVLMLQWTVPTLAQGISVERVQREFQARYHQLTGGYVEWPKVYCKRFGIECGSQRGAILKIGKRIGC